MGRFPIVEKMLLEHLRSLAREISEILSREELDSEALEEVEALAGELRDAARQLADLLLPAPEEP